MIYKPIGSKKLAQRFAACMAVLELLSAGTLALLWLNDFFGWTPLRQICEGVKFNSTIGFSLVAYGLFCYTYRSDSKFFSRSAKASSLLLIAFSLLSLFQFLFPNLIDFAQWIVKDTHAMAGEQPGQISMSMIICFLGVGLGLYCSLRKQALIYGQIAFVMVLSYTYFRIIDSCFDFFIDDHQKFYLTEVYDAVGDFFLLCLAFIFSQPKRGFWSLVRSNNQGGNMLRTALLSALFIPIFTMGLDEIFTRTLIGSDAVYSSFMAFLFMEFVILVSFPIAIKLNEIDKENERNLYRLNRGQSTARMGSWEIDLRSRAIYWTDGMYQLHGVDKHQFVLTLDSSMQFFTQESKPIIQQAYRRAIKEQSTVELETTLQTVSGTIFWAKVIMEVEIKPNNSGMIIRGITRDISERKKAQSDLDRVQKAAKLGFWTYDVDTKKIEWSKEIYTINHKKQGDAITTENLWSMYEPSYGEMLREQFIRCIKEGTAFDVEVLSYIEEKEVWKRIIGNSVVESGRTIRITGITQDITEKKLAEDRIKKDEANLISVIESTDDMIISLDQNRNLVTFNKPFRYFCKVNYNVEVKQGDSVIDFFDPSVRDMWRESIDKALAGEKYSFEYTTKFLKGEPQHLHINFTPIKKDDEVTGTVMVSRNITEKFNYEKNLLEQKELAEEASKAKSQFLSVMSHEIRTPLNAIIGLGNLLLENNPKPEQLQRLKTLKFSSENLLTIVNDILDYNKIESDKMVLESISFNLQEVLSQVYQTYEIRTQEKGISLDLVIGEEVPVGVIGDPTRLSQVLMNLLNNAVKFTETGSIRIVVEQVNAMNGQSTISFAISDTGIGIPENKMQSVFELFTQADSATTRRFGGTGLGLPICKRILEKMGAELKVKSEVNKGSTFYFDLTLSCSTAADQLPALSGDELFDLTGVHILVVEDNPVNQLVAGEFLTGWNAKVSFADNGKLGLEAIQKAKYDLVLMDIQMPEMSGIEATEAVRKLKGDYYQQVPIIALTASISEDTKGVIKEAGMNGYVPKPFKPEQLYQTISKILAGLTTESSNTTGDFTLQDQASRALIHQLDDYAADYSRIMLLGDYNDLRVLNYGIKSVLQDWSFPELQQLMELSEQLLLNGADDGTESRIQLIGSMEDVCQRIKGSLIKS